MESRINALEQALYGVGRVVQDHGIPTPCPATQQRMVNGANAFTYDLANHYLQRRNTVNAGNLSQPPITVNVREVPSNGPAGRVIVVNGAETSGKAGAQPAADAVKTAVDALNNGATYAAAQPTPAATPAAAPGTTAEVVSESENKAPAENKSEGENKN